MPLKIYVEVIAKFDIDGNITPLSIRWEDGTIYEIDRTLGVHRRASLRAGGAGMRYTCIIRRQKRYLYLENSRWFVEGT